MKRDYLPIENGESRGSLMVSEHNIVICKQINESGRLTVRVTHMTYCQCSLLCTLTTLGQNECPVVWP
jgi:hypothetical protein